MSNPYFNRKDGVMRLQYALTGPLCEIQYVHSADNPTDYTAFTFVHKT